MSAKKRFVDGDIVLMDGKILRNKKQIGTTEGGYRFGYHPSVRVEVGKAIQWFEWDDKDLYKQIANYAREVDNAKQIRN